MSTNHVEELRHQLSRLNHDILRLLNERTAIALKVLAEKSRLGMPSYVPTREDAMISELTRSNSGPLSDESVKAVFLELFRATRKTYADQESVDGGANKPTP